MERAFSVRPRGKNHEVQTEVHSESDNSLNVGPVVVDEMDEEDMDDKEEQSESGAVRVGRNKMMTPMNGHTFLIEAGADIVSLHGQEILLIEAKVCKGGRRCQRHETSELRLLRPARSARNEISKDPGVERSRYSHGVSSCGEIERCSHLLGEPAMRSGFGTLRTLWPDHSQV